MECDLFRQQQYRSEYSIRLGNGELLQDECARLPVLFSIDFGVIKNNETRPECVSIQKLEKQAVSLIRNLTRKEKAIMNKKIKL